MNESLVKYMVKDSLIENIILCILYIFLPFSLIGTFTFNHIHLLWTVTLFTMLFAKSIMYLFHFNNPNMKNKALILGYFLLILIRSIAITMVDI